MVPFFFRSRRDGNGISAETGMRRQEHAKSSLVTEESACRNNLISKQAPPASTLAESDSLPAIKEAVDHLYHRYQEDAIQ
jgi:hypothetical protein